MLDAGTLSVYSSHRSYGTISQRKDHEKSAKEETGEEEAPPPKVESRTTKILRGLNLGLMCLVVIGYGMCAALFAPFFPVEAEKRGISATTVGFIFGTFTLVMFLGSLISGLLVRKLGLTFMIWSGTLLAGGSTVLFGLLDQSPIGDAYVVLCFAVRIIEGAGASLYNTAAFSIAAQLYPKSVSTVYSIMQSSNGVGRMIGPSFGGLLYNAGGFSLPFYVVGAMLLAFGFISMLLLRCTLPPDASGESEKGNSKKAAKALPWSHFFRYSFEIWILTFALASSSLIVGFPAPTLALYYETLGLTDPATVGLIFLGGSMSYTFLSLIVGKLSDTFAKYVYLIMAFGSFMFFVGFFFIGPIPPVKSAIPPSIALTSTCYVILISGIAFVLNPAPTAIITAAKAAGFKEGLDLSAMVASLYNALWFLGSFASAPLAGALMDAVGFEWGSFIMAMIALITLVVLLLGSLLHRFRGGNKAGTSGDGDYAVLLSESGASVVPRNSKRKNQEHAIEVQV